MQLINDAEPFEYYEESRKYPRVKIELPVKLMLEDKSVAFANIYDISPDGIQIRCSGDVAVRLNPDGKKIDQYKNVIVKATFSLPINNELKEVCVYCKVYYFVLLKEKSDKNIAFGLQFKKFEGQSVKYIGRHILSELEPASDFFHNNFDRVDLN